MGYLRALFGNTQRIVRLAISAAGIAAGVSTLGRNRGLGVTLLVFGIFTLGHLAFDVGSIYLEKKSPSAKQEHQAFAEFVASNQTAVITAAGTILGLVTAFSQRPLPAATIVAVIGLGAGVLILFVTYGSGAPG